MKTLYILVLSLLVSLAPNLTATAAEQTVSGRVIGGYRVLPLPATEVPWPQRSWLMRVLKGFIIFAMGLTTGHAVDSPLSGIDGSPLKVG